MIRKIIIFIIAILLLVGCGRKYYSYSTPSTQYYNVSVLNEVGRAVYHFPCVKVISRESGNGFEEITFRSLDGEYYCVRGKAIILTKTTHRSYRRSYYYYDPGPDHHKIRKYHYYHDPKQRPKSKPGPRPKRRDPKPSKRDRR